MRYELTDYEWTAIKPFLPGKPRGVPRVNDRRDLPETFGPYTTCYNRFVRWGRAGVWDQIMDALAAMHDAAVQMIDTQLSECISTVAASRAIASNTWADPEAG